MHTLKDRGFDADENATTIEEAREEILEAFRKKEEETMIRDITLGQ